MNFELWNAVYQKDLEYMYEQCVRVWRTQKKVTFRRLIPFAVFCRTVYDQSSKKIHREDRKAFMERYSETETI